MRGSNPRRWSLEPWITRKKKTKRKKKKKKASLSQIILYESRMIDKKRKTGVYSCFKGFSEPKVDLGFDPRGCGSGKKKTNMWRKEIEVALVGKSESLMLGQSRGLGPYLGQGEWQKTRELGGRESLSHTQTDSGRSKVWGCISSQHGKQKTEKNDNGKKKKREKKKMKEGKKKRKNDKRTVDQKKKFFF